MNGLLPYEENEIKEILEWQKKEPSIISQFMGAALKPLSMIVEKIVPTKAIEGCINGANWLAESLTDTKDILRDGKVESINELKHKSLAISDRLANNVHNWAVGTATVEGGAAGFFGIPGMIADIPTLVTMGLRVIHKIGICYGFECKTQEDKNFILGIMSLAGANTMQEKNAAILLLTQISVKITQHTWAELAMKNGVIDMAIIAIKNLAKQLGINITKRKALQSIPLIGLGVGAAMNGQFLNDIAWAARRTFQYRWLQDNDKILKLESKVEESATSSETE